MENYNLLSVLLSLPLAAFAVTWVMPKTIQRMYAIFASIVVLAVSIYVAVQTGDSPWEVKLAWVPELGLSLSLKWDSISKWFVVVNALVAVIAMSLRGPWYRKSPRLFTALGFFLVFALNAAFLSQDLIVFYLAYEAVFIPMIFMVGIWGSQAKAAAVLRFFLMSFLGSVLMLVSIFSLIYLFKEQSGQYSSFLPDLIQAASVKGGTALHWCFLGFFLAFAIKVPVFPFHGWLKDVYVNAPMPATIWMSAILSKLGIYGFIRFVNPLFPDVAHFDQGWILLISAISILYAAFLAIRARSPKELLAYSSISHLGFVMLAVYSLVPGGAASAVLLSIGHALVSALLFYGLSLVEERQPIVDLSLNYGLAKAYPVLFTLLFVSVLWAVALPGTLNFMGEFLALFHAYSASVPSVVLGAFGVVFGAVYMLRFYQQLGLGQLSGEQKVGKDLGMYDIALMGALILALIYFGFQPMLFLKGNG